MDSIFIPIARNTIRPNLQAGSREILVPGKTRTRITADGMRVLTPIQRIPTIYSQPLYLYEYEPVKVTCDYCEKTFPWTDLEEEFEDYDDDYYHRARICPHCGTEECCPELVFEKISNAIQEVSKDEK